MVPPVWIQFCRPKIVDGSQRSSGLKNSSSPVRSSACSQCLPARAALGVLKHRKHPRRNNRTNTWLFAELRSRTTYTPRRVGCTRQALSTIQPALVSLAVSYALIIHYLRKYANNAFRSSNFCVDEAERRLLCAFFAATRSVFVYIHTGTRWAGPSRVHPNLTGGVFRSRRLCTVYAYLQYPTPIDAGSRLKIRTNLLVIA